jgi:hypothetical protein
MGLNFDMKKTFRLTHAVLASSLFLAPSVFAQQGPTQITGINTASPPAAGPPYLTSVTGNIEILPAGQVLVVGGANDGIDVDSPSASIVLDANNINGGNAILINGGGTGAGINIKATATLATITVNTGSNINTSAGTGDAIDVNETGATINNTGLIFGGGKGIYLSGTGTNASINNNAGGVIQGIGFAPVYADGTGLTLTNSGTIQTQGAANNAVRLNVDFTTVTNNANAIIQSTNADAIFLNGATKGNVINSGFINSPGTGAGVSINAGAYTGTITNNVGGIIQSTNAAGTAAFIINSSFGAINNAGIIQSTKGPVNAVIVTANTSGTLTNTGTIQALGTGNAINFNAATGFTGIVNSGTISAIPTVATINASAAGVTVANGIINTGNIISHNAQPAIDLSGAGNLIPLFQQGGTITGNVLLAGGGGTVSPNFALTMTGGTIAGNVTSSGTAASTLQLNGGTINGNVTTGNVAGNIVNLTGTTINGALSNSGNNDIFNLSGGSFTSLTGTGPSVVNVVAPFTSTGTISIPTLNVINAGTTFTNDNVITNVNTALNINANTIMTAEANVTGTGTLTINPTGVLQIDNGVIVSMGSVANAVNNNGELQINNNGVLLTGGAYNQNGDFATRIQDMSLVAPFGFGQIDVNGVATFAPGSTVSAELGSGTFILNNFAFPIIQTNAPIPTFNNLSIDQPTSAILFFTLDNTINPNDVNLIAHTNPLVTVAVPDIPLSIAATLDALVPTTPAQIAALDPDLLRLFGELQILPNITAVSDALLLLAPPFNYSIPGSTRIVMNNAFDSVQARIEALNGLGPLTQDEDYRKERDYELYNGVNYGDSNVIDLTTGRFGAWFKVFGEIDDQHKRHQIEGYRADAVGISLGGDWKISPYALIGVAESLSKINTKDYTSAQNKVNINSYQTTFYGWFQPMQMCSSALAPSLYIDTMLGVATHKYDTLRNINIGTVNAQSTANFFGLQYGAQMDVGYAFISSDDWYVAPVARFKYTYLQLDDYSETGAGGLSLNVLNDDLDEVIAGIGIRLAAVKNYVQAIYVPEFSVMLLYDFAGSVQQSQSNFLAGGNPFYTNSIKPAQYIQLYGLGINAYTSDNYTFSIKVNFEHRDHFYGYDGFMQLHYKWD